MDLKKEKWTPATKKLMDWSLGGLVTFTVTTELRETAWVFDGSEYKKNNGGVLPKLTKVFTDKNSDKILLEKMKFINFDLSEIFVNSNTTYFKNAEVVFENCLIEKITYLGLADSTIWFVELDKEKLCNIDIKDGVSLGSALFFEGGNLKFKYNKKAFLAGSLEFTKSVFISFEFSGSFTGSLEIRDCIFEGAPNFNVLEVSQQFSIEGNHFKDHNAQSIHLYRKLKKLLQENSDTTQANTLFSHELQCRLAGQSWSRNFPEKLVGFFYWIFSNYGLSIAVPLILLIISSATFALVDSLYIFNKVDSFSLYFGHHFIGPFSLVTDHFDVTYTTIASQYYRFFSGLWISLSYFFLVFGVRKRFKIN